MSVAIPRIRDFRGLSPRSFDGRGNYSIGVREQIIFPEIDYDAIDQVRGLDVTITTSANTDEEAYALLRELGMPFSREGAPGDDSAEREAAEEEQRKEEARARAEAEQAALEQLATIARQKPSVRRARKSIANFKLRDGMPVGVSVTLRRAHMWEFLDRLTSVAIPRIRDFRGLNPRSFDGRGNYSMGIREQIIFPEIDYDSIDETRGLDVTITTSAATDEQAYYLLRELGMPFSREGAPGEAPSEAAEAAEEQRKEEARLRAEAEQAALEQLKEENPEAYEKPAAAEDAEGEGEEQQGKEE